VPFVFIWLAVANLVVLLLTAVFGLFADAVHPERHILLATFTLLVTVLVQAIVLTYFAATGRMLIQAVRLAGLGEQVLREARGLKRAATRGIGLVMAAVVVTVVTGAAGWNAPVRTTYHLSAAGILLLTVGYALYRQYLLVADNAALMEQTMEQYTQARTRGEAARPGSGSA
jgi:hypothetical protein